MGCSFAPHLYAWPLEAEFSARQSRADICQPLTMLSPKNVRRCSRNLEAKSKGHHRMTSFKFPLQLSGSKPGAFGANRCQGCHAIRVRAYWYCVLVHRASPGLDPRLGNPGSRENEERRGWEASFAQNVTHSWGKSWCQVDPSS